MSIDIGLVTSTRFPQLDPDSALLLPALRARGLSAAPVIWTDAEVDWSQFSLCLIRSTWDYAEQRQRYLAWAERAGIQTRLWNPPSVLRWNTDKRYLLELAQRGIDIVPSVWLEKGAPFSYDYLCAIWNTTRLILKPTVSAGARNIFVVSTRDDPRVRALLDSQDALVQPYLETVTGDGELSMIFFGGELSHAVRKRPQTGDFRVQEEHGGIYTVVTSTPGELQAAQKVLAAVGQPLLYARIDFMFGGDGELLLSEVEITEPSLYHHHAPSSVHTLADHLAMLLTQNPAGSTL